MYEPQTNNQYFGFANSYTYSYLSALQVEEPISETSYGNIRVLEYVDEVVEINSFEEWTFIRSEPKTDEESAMIKPNKAPLIHGLIKTPLKTPIKFYYNMSFK